MRKCREPIPDPKGEWVVEYIPLKREVAGWARQGWHEFRVETRYHLGPALAFAQEWRNNGRTMRVRNIKTNQIVMA